MTRLPQGQRLEHNTTGRACAADGCDTVLSRYNPSGTCTAHAGWQDHRRRRLD